MSAKAKLEKSVDAMRDLMKRVPPSVENDPEGNRIVQEVKILLNRIDTEMLKKGISHG